MKTIKMNVSIENIENLLNCIKVLKDKIDYIEMQFGVYSAIGMIDVTIRVFDDLFVEVAEFIRRWKI